MFLSQACPNLFFVIPCRLPLLKVDDGSLIKMRIFEHTNVHYSVIHSSQVVEVAHISINRSMDRENVVCAYNGILLSLKKDRGTCCNMDES